MIKRAIDRLMNWHPLSHEAGETVEEVMQGISDAIGLLVILFAVLMLAGCADPIAPEAEPEYDVRAMVQVKDTLVVFYGRDFNDRAPGLAWLLSEDIGGHVESGSLISTTVAVFVLLREAAPMQFCVWVVNERDAGACVSYPEDLQ